MNQGGDWIWTGLELQWSSNPSCPHGRWQLRQSLGYSVCLSVMCHRHKSRWGRHGTQGPACAASKYTELIQGAFPEYAHWFTLNPVLPADSRQFGLRPSLEAALKIQCRCSDSVSLSIASPRSPAPPHACGSGPWAPRSAPLWWTHQAIFPKSLLFTPRRIAIAGQKELNSSRQSKLHGSNVLAHPKTVNHFWKGRTLPGMFIHIETLHKHATCPSTWTQPYAPMNTHMLPSVCVCMSPSASTRFLAGSSFCPCPTNSRHYFSHLQTSPLFLALLSCLPANMPSLYLLSLAASPLPTPVLFNQANSLLKGGAIGRRWKDQTLWWLDPTMCQSLFMSHLWPTPQWHSWAHLEASEPHTLTTKHPSCFCLCLQQTALHTIARDHKEGCQICWFLFFFCFLNLSVYRLL